MDWPEGAISRESIKAVMKLPRLPVCTYGFMALALFCFFNSMDIFEGPHCEKRMGLFFTPVLVSQICLLPWQNLVMQHVDHSAGDLIDLLQGLLRYDPSNRLTPQDALRHPFFTRDYHSRF